MKLGLTILFLALIVGGGINIALSPWPILTTMETLVIICMAVLALAIPMLAAFVLGAVRSAFS